MDTHTTETDQLELDPQAPPTPAPRTYDFGDYAFTPSPSTGPAVNLAAHRLPDGTLPEIPLFVLPPGTPQPYPGYSADYDLTPYGTAAGPRTARR